MPSDTNTQYPVSTEHHTPAHLEHCPHAWRRPFSAYNQGCRCPDNHRFVQRKWRTDSRRQRLDEVVVDRVVSGEPMRISLRERRELVDRLSRAGLSAARIAQQLGCSPRTVNRHRALLKQMSREKPVAVPCGAPRREAA